MPDDMEQREDLEQDFRYYDTLTRMKEHGEWYWAEVVFQKPAPAGSVNPCPVALTRVWVPHEE